MNPIKSSLPVRSGLPLLLAVLLLSAGVAARGARSPKTVSWFDHYYDGSGFDLNDDLSRMSHLRAAHRQEVTETVTTETTAPVTVGVVKNDDLLPTNLFVTPPSSSTRPTPSRSPLATSRSCRP